MSRAARDALFAAGCVVLGGVLCVKLEGAERLTKSLLRWEFIQLDDLLLTACLGVFMASWFALRRWREAQRALQAHRQSEREKAGYVTKLEELSAQLLQTEQAERTRLAELLHDDVGQTLYACRLQLERAQSRTHDAELSALLDEAYTLAGSAMSDARELSSQISPPILHDLGLADAVEWLLSRTERHFGVSAQFVSSEAWHEIHARLHEPVFHSVRELVTNAAKHARASSLRVWAERDGARIEVHVQDDGRGMPKDPSRTRGFGLFSVERRMACLGAQLQIASQGERGTRASLLLPAG